jgi:hypothetical protein
MVELSRGLKDEFIISQDSDTKHCFVDNFQCMLSFLKEHSDVGIVSLSKIVKPSEQMKHIMLACSMWRREVFSKMPMLNIDSGDFNTCCCGRYKLAIEVQGFKALYLDSMKRIEEAIK